MLYLLAFVLGAVLGVGAMCLSQINREVPPIPAETAPPVAIAKEEPRSTPAYRYDPITRKPTRRLP